jgi:Transposase
MELPRLDGHLILRVDPGGRRLVLGRPAKYPAKFRREAVALVKSSERGVAEVARSLGIAEGTVPFGKYWRSAPLVFSFVPRCHGL